MKHIDILKNLNTRFVLLKNEDSYIIMDKLRHTMVTINDPYIDINKLFRGMISNGVQTFNSLNDLPPIIEFPTLLLENKPKHLKLLLERYLIKKEMKQAQSYQL